MTDKRAWKEMKLIAEWRRTEREKLRVSVGVFHGREVIALRTWYRQSGKYLPGDSGITLDIKHVNNLASAFKKALGYARRKGLIE